MMHFALQKKLHTATGNMQLNIDCDIPAGSFVSLYGSSGAGKTSILRMLAGFMKPDNGFIKMNDSIWFEASKQINIEPQKRKVGFVFQDYALFPNMNVKENIAFASPKNELKKIVVELLDLTGLTNFADRKIQTLSGGQKQRVALARAIAAKPLLLLLDEPLSAIDAVMRQQLQNTLLNVHQRFGLTTILVSHDMDEIIKLSDTIIHIEGGTIQQNTTPVEFFFNRMKTANLTGNIISIENNGDETTTIVLINNRMMKANSMGGNIKFNMGEKVKIVYENSIPVIYKL